MASLFGCSRKTQTKIRVLPWLIGINNLPPTFWGQHHWSGNAGSCVDYTWNISLRLPCGKQFQHSFDFQQWFETWWSRIKRKTIFVLFAYWPKGWRSSKSRKYWLFCAASCSIRAKLMEKAPGYDILDWYWSWNHRRKIEISIKRNRMQSSFKEYFHQVALWKLKDWKAQYLSPRPPPKISLRNDFDWAKGKDNLGFTVEHRRVGKFVQQSLGETVHFGSSK